MSLDRFGRPVTLKDVAGKAGVSVSTASRALDERLPASRSAAAARVREAAAALGYSRDVLASSLRRQGTDTVGVLVPRLTDTVMAVLFEALYREAARRGLFAIVSTTGDEAARHASATDALMRRKVDGLILTTARTDVDTTRVLRERGVPHVLALRTDGTTPSAVGDDRLGGYMATRHLLDLGHRDIALVGGAEYASSAIGRELGFVDAMSEAGVLPKSEWMTKYGFQIDDGERAGTHLLSQSRRPTAIFAVNDNTAIGVMAAAHQLGISIPADLSLVGYNDIPLATRLPVPLTTVRVPFERIASDALELLLNQRDDGPVLVSQPSLIPRASAIRLG